MVHLLKNARGQFYWLVLSPKANTYEEIGKTTETHPAKEDAVRSIQIIREQLEWPMMHVDREQYYIDHTGRSVKLFAVLKGYPIREVTPGENLKQRMDAEVKYLKSKLKKK